jgi:hypothetical protein
VSITVLCYSDLLRVCLYGTAGRTLEDDEEAKEGISEVVSKADQAGWREAYAHVHLIRIL